MAMPDPVGWIPEAWQATIEALLIGFLIGAQREASHIEQRHAGVRDFVLIALSGSICGLLGNGWLAGAALVSITVLLAVFYLKAKERTGITTEMAAVATFCLGFLTAAPNYRPGRTLAVGAAVITVAFLEAKRSLHKLLHETVTEEEFNDTLVFLATIFVIYPILPKGRYGPYDFFAPRVIWVFVILVSSISFVGYFFEKFLGPSRGLKLTSVFGGLASTTAATLAFGHRSAEEPLRLSLYGQAAVIANAMQFPRMLALLIVVNAQLAAALALPLIAAGIAGLGVGLLMARGEPHVGEHSSMRLQNPFRLVPALEFGLIFTVILFAAKASTSVFGSWGLFWASVAGGSIDVDSVAVSTADLLTRGHIFQPAAMLSVLLALLSNAVIKTGIAAYAGSPRFALRVASGFIAMFGTGVLAWYVISGL
jgi:uncharacterized membrane protein (DUF4010 family)